MLVLSRNDREWITIRVPGRTRPIRLVLVKGTTGQARLAFDADGDIDINRDEVDRDIQRNGSRRRLLAG